MKELWGNDAWIDWATGEPAGKQHNLETLDVLLELAEEQGLNLILQVYMDSAPHWVGVKYPDSLFVSAGGEVIQPESSVSPNVEGVSRDHNFRVFDEYARRWYERAPEPVVK